MTHSFPVIVNFAWILRINTYQLDPIKFVLGIAHMWSYALKLDAGITRLTRCQIIAIEDLYSSVSSTADLVIARTYNLGIPGLGHHAGMHLYEFPSVLVSYSA